MELAQIVYEFRNTAQKEVIKLHHLESKAARPIPPLQGIYRVDLSIGLDVYRGGLVSDLMSLQLRSISLLKNIR